MKAVLFDFFGTLVNYSDSRTEQGYLLTHSLLSKAGINLSYDTFLQEWSYSHARYDRYTVETGIEYNMGMYQRISWRSTPRNISLPIYHATS